MRYIRVNSLTWWAGFFALLVGIARMVLPDNFALTELGRLITLLAGGADASPAALIAVGLIGIGLRDKLERAYGRGSNDNTPQPDNTALGETEPGA